ncbi:unnamed protein product [Periconia digitata]|uniref:Uncharacterized protein n=1 Tax=Periconia digitata TaxID=1303443 RepID=A0A9W4UNN4_9PLEO|nr:unnamed protein product [Periconia digitata]
MHLTHFGLASDALAADTEMWKPLHGVFTCARQQSGHRSRPSLSSPSAGYPTPQKLHAVALIPKASKAMASKLCCTAEDASRTSSPALPNIRMSEATPAKLPLLSDHTHSQGSSRFTSAQTGDLCEIRNIFQNASSDHPNPSPRAKAGHARFIKPSMYSLRSIHRIKSVQSMIRRKLSKDLSKKSSRDHTQAGGGVKNAALGTASDIPLKLSQDPPNLKLKLTKFDLKENLLSDKDPHEGGYDPDAEVLDDIRKNVGRRAPKRPSIHSIEWSPSNGSKPTPGSSSRSRHMQPAAQLQPYHIRPQAKSLSSSFGKILSSPDLQSDSDQGHERKLRRSQSAASVNLPAPRPLSSPRLPSLRGSEIEGMAWSTALNESLRLSQLPLPPGRAGTAQSRASLRLPTGWSNKDTGGSKLQNEIILTPDVHVQEPTATTTPRPSSSVHGTVRINSAARLLGSKSENDKDDVQDDARESIHLYSMRISHHLRSGSLVSWDNNRDPPGVSGPVPPLLRDESNSDLSQIARRQTQLSRHNRQTSSSGFASSNIPSKWGRVVSGDIREDKSSIYSSRPQSPPDGGSSSNLTRTLTLPDSYRKASSKSINLSRSNSCSENVGNTHGTAPKFPSTDPSSFTGSLTSNDQLSGESTQLMRINSSFSTKKSRFREEFSPSPPKRRITASASIMKLLNPKRSGFRSQSEGKAKSSIEPSFDGSLEPPKAATYRERRMSRSMVSFEREQKSLGKDEKISPMWEKALKHHQNERAAFFITKDRNLAVRSSPFRERSASVARPRPSMDSNASPGDMGALKGVSTPFLEPPSSDHPIKQTPEAVSSRRIAIVGADAADTGLRDEVQRRYEQQGDSVDVVGAWGRYPSHSRDERTLSAGHLDSVQTRDFALEAALKFAAGKDTETNEDEVDPTERPVTPPLLPGEKKRHKKIGNMRMVKSTSMTFGKTFLRNYARLFKSQSIEFQKHGRGHRTSISSGGMLEFPELEILPDIWRRGVIEEQSGETSQRSSDKHDDDDEGHISNVGVKENSMGQDSRSTLRAPNSTTTHRDNTVPGLDGQMELSPITDNARVLSAYYEDCLPAFPRVSKDLDCNLEDFGAPARRSLDGQCVSMHTRTLPGRFTKHSRNASRVSRLSIVSTASLHPSFISSYEDDNAMDQMSIASVRRSTMDLISIYKEQEVTEREKVLSLMRAESKKGSQMLAGL